MKPWWYWLWINLAKVKIHKIAERKYFFHYWQILAFMKNFLDESRYLRSVKFSNWNKHWSHHQWKQYTCIFVPHYPLNIHLSLLVHCRVHPVNSISLSGMITGIDFGRKFSWWWHQIWRPVIAPEKIEFTGYIPVTKRVRQLNQAVANSIRKYCIR